MKILQLSAIFCVLSISAFAQTTLPDFSGEWVLDRSKSTMPDRMKASIQGMEMEVDQNEKKIKVTLETKQGAPVVIPGGNSPNNGAEAKPISMVGGSSVAKTTLSYSLDGKEGTSNVAGPMGGTVKVKTVAKVDGSVLTLSSSRTLDTPMGEIRMNTSDVWELQTDGSLKMKRKLTTSQGDQSAELIFVKKAKK